MASRSERFRTGETVATRSLVGDIRCSGWKVSFHSHVMARLEATHGAGTGTHHDAVGFCILTTVAHTLQKLTIGYPRSREKDVVTVDKIVHGEDAVEVADAGVDSPLTLFVTAGPKLTLHLATQTFESACRENRFRRSPHAHQDV